MLEHRKGRSAVRRAIARHFETRLLMSATMLIRRNRDRRSRRYCIPRQIPDNCKLRGTLGRLRKLISGYLGAFILEYRCRRNFPQNLSPNCAAISESQRIRIIVERDRNERNLETERRKHSCRSLSPIALSSVFPFSLSSSSSFFFLFFFFFPPRAKVCHRQWQDREWIDTRELDVHKVELTERTRQARRDTGAAGARMVFEGDVSFVGSRFSPTQKSRSIISVPLARLFRIPLSTSERSLILCFRQRSPPPITGVKLPPFTLSLPLLPGPLDAVT